MKIFILALQICILVLPKTSFGQTRIEERFLLNQTGNQVLDKDTGLIWLRCPLGTKSSGSSCVGEPMLVTFDERKKIVEDFNASGGVDGVRNWTIPSLNQLSKIMHCRLGSLIFYERDLDKPKAQVANGLLSYCGNRQETIFPRENIYKPAFPRFSRDGGTAAVWSDTPFFDGKAWLVDFNRGRVDYFYNNGEMLMGLIRPGVFIGTEESIAFRYLPSGRRDFTMVNKYFGAMNDDQLKARYATASDEDKFLMEGIFVKRHSDKLAIVSFKASAGSTKAYGPDDAGFGAQLMTAIGGMKLGVETSTPIDYSVQLDPKLFKVSGKYKFSADIVLKATGEGEYETYCMWPLNTTCKNSKTEDKYTQSISGVLSQNDVESGRVNVVWSPKYEKKSMMGLWSTFVTKKIDVSLINLKLEQVAE